MSEKHAISRPNDCFLTKSGPKYSNAVPDITNIADTNRIDLKLHQKSESIGLQYARDRDECER